MKKILLATVLIFCFQCMFSNAGQAQTASQEEPPQFSLPIWPEKVWRSEYSNYRTDVHNCCDWLLYAAAGFNLPKREECTNFLIRWIEGAPDVQLFLAEGIVDYENEYLFVAYLAGWTRHQLDNPDAGTLVCANVAVNEMLAYYDKNRAALGKSKVAEKLLKLRSRNQLSPYIKKCLVGDDQPRAKEKKRGRKRS